MTTRITGGRLVRCASRSGRPEPRARRLERPSSHPDTPRQSFRQGVLGRAHTARKRRMFGQIETGGSRHRHFDAGPPGLKSAGETPWFNSRNAWKLNLQGRLRTGGHKAGMGRPYGPEEISGEIVSQQNTGCLPTTPAPEGRHNLCRGRKAPGLEGKKLPHLPAGCRRQRHFDAGPRRLRTMLESRTGSGVFAVRSSRRTRLIFITDQSPMMTCLNRSLHTPYKSPVGCVSRSHGTLGDATPPNLSSSNIDRTPSSRSRTHQNQSQPGRSCPPLPARTRSCRLSLRRLSPPAGRVSALRA